jgi:hypothetical protein
VKGEEKKKKKEKRRGIKRLKKTKHRWQHMAAHTTTAKKGRWLSGIFSLPHFTATTSAS